MTMTKNYGALRLLISFILTTLVYAQQSNDYANSMQMLQLVNNARIQNNVRPLCLSEKLVRSATAHATYQASINTMTHDGPVSLGDRFTQQGYQPSAVAENVGFTSTPFIQVVFDIWMSSPEHRANILDPNYVHFGAASSMGSNNMYFWTQLFAKPLNLYAEPCDFAAAATAAHLSPGQTGFSPNGAWGGSNNYNAYTPGMNPNGNCISIDNGMGGKSLSCKLNGSNGPAGPNAIPYNSPNPYAGPNGLTTGGPSGINGIYNPAVGPNAGGINNNANPITDPMGPNVINNPPGYDGTSCTVVSTSPAPDGQGSVRVLRCGVNQPSNVNMLNPRVSPNAPSIQPMPDGSAIMINNPNAINTPGTGYNNGINGVNPPGTGYNSPGTGYNSPGTSYYAPGTSYNPPGTNYNPPGTSYNPAGPAPRNPVAINAPANGVFSPFWN